MMYIVTLLAVFCMYFYLARKISSTDICPKTPSFLVRISLKKNCEIQERLSE